MPASKSFLPGMRGGMAFVLLILILKLLALLFHGWINIFGFADQPGYIDALDTGGFESIPPTQVAYIMFDILWPFLVATYASYVLYSFMKAKRIFPRIFLGGILLSVFVMVVDATAYYSLFSELPMVGSSGGVVISVAIYHYLITSPRAKTTLVN